LQVRYNFDDDTDLPHIYGHGVTEAEVERVLLHPTEDRPGRNDSRIAIGMTDSGRILKVIHVPDLDRLGTFVVTAFDLTGKALAAYRRRIRKRGRR
jgi:hypothetical protein